MSDINLLPEDFRKKETKELSGRKSFDVDQKLVMPAEDKKETPEKKKSPSFFSRFHKPTATPVVSPASSMTARSVESVTYRPAEKKVTPEQASSYVAPETMTRPIPAVTAPVSMPKPVEKPPLTTFTKPAPKKRRSWNLFKRSSSQRLTAGQEVSHGDATLDVNLIPSELSRRPELDLPRKMIISGGIIATCLIIIIAIYLGITWYQLQITRDIESLQSQITDIDAQIAQLERDKNDATLLQQQLQATRTLLDKHVYWTKFFDLLAQHTAPDVYYTNFSMTGRDKLVISAVAKDYKAIARQLTIFQDADNFIKNVRIDAASAVINQESGLFSGVSFTINLEFVPDIFFKPLE